MAVYKRRYRPYHGPLTPERSRFLVLTRYAFAGLFRSRVFVLLFVLALVPTLFFAAYIFLANNSAVQQFLQFHVAGGFAVENKFFFTLTMIQTQLAFLLNCWVCPTLVAGDLVNGALPLFLSRPFSRPEYVLGKCAVIALLLSVVTWVPGLILFSLQAGLAEGGWTLLALWPGGGFVGLDFDALAHFAGRFGVGEATHRGYWCYLLCVSRACGTRRDFQHDPGHLLGKPAQFLRAVQVNPRQGLSTGI